MTAASKAAASRKGHKQSAGNQRNVPAAATNEASHDVSVPYRLHLGNCLEVMRAMPDNSVDSVVTDPPYELGFMGKSWDATGIAYNVEMWREALRVLKPGGHLLAFSGSRTYHRMVCAIEDAGFEIRDQIMWVYGCLDEQTEVATASGVMPYHKTKVGDLVLCYDADEQQYSYQPILEVVEYDYCDTAYRLVGDFGEQVVSRNHRCIIERGGSEVFEYAEALQCEARVPVLEDLPALRRALHDAYERAGYPKQKLQPGMQGGGDWREAPWGKAAGNPQRKDGGLHGVWKHDVEAGRLATQDKTADVQSPVQWGIARRGVGRARSQGAGSMDREQQCLIREEDVRTEQSCMEGRANVSQPEGRVFTTGNQIRALPVAVSFDGAQGWVRNGAPAAGGASHWPCVDAHRSSTPCEPRCDGQQTAKPDAVCNEWTAQGIRAWSGHKTAVVRVVPFQYTGKVWCLRVPTGAFVAVRNGVAFPTGNSGFPKSLDVSKALDKAAGANREVIGRKANYHSEGKHAGTGTSQHGVRDESFANPEMAALMTAPATEAARQWEGWGTALKPAHEPICVGRKPLIGTVAGNVMQFGTGAINIDECRVPIDPLADASQLRTMARSVRQSADGWGMSTVSGDTPQVVRPDGRWPANLIHDGSSEVLAMFPDAAGQQGAITGREPTAAGFSGNTHGDFAGQRSASVPRQEDNRSSARFFYCAKSSKSDRGVGNTHPTVKPLTLMQYLVRLVTPPGGIVLDPFMGSGSTGKAALREGFRFVGIDMTPEYLEIARKRIGEECGQRA